MFKRKPLACECHWFENMAKNESIPIVFDAVMNEYHLVQNDGQGHVMLYYCPFCGGSAPKSLSGTHWTEVSIKESHRLHTLTKDIKTPEELFSKFGTPDHDIPIGGGSISPGSKDEPPTATVGARRVVYTSLSDTAEVHVEIDRYDRLSFSFAGRYIGPS